MLPLLVLLAQTDDLASDARLRAPLTVAERYLPLPEFARRLQAATKAPVRVSPEMAARKLVLFVDGRPAAETMRMAANALGGRWVRLGLEWRLRVDPRFDRDEESASAAFQAARRSAVLAWADGFAKAPGPSGEIPAVAKASGLIAKIGPAAATDTLLTGRSLLATMSGRDGSVSMPLADAFDVAATDAILGLRLSEDGRFVTIRLTPLGDFVGGGVTTGASVGVPHPPPTDEERHAAAWGIDADPAASATSLATKALDKEPYPSGLSSLSDVLDRLHARSGRPIVAEAFRTPLRLYGEIPGGTVREALSALAKDVSWTRYPFAWRSQDGWILARPARPWSLRPGEIPESALRPLEGRDPTLDQYADLAASLTEPQVAATARDRPLARFSTAPFRDIRTLALFGTLDAAARATARGKGILYADMPPAARARWDRVYGDLVMDFPSKDGTYFDLVAGKRPLDGGLRVTKGKAHYASDPDRPLMAVPPGGRSTYTAYAADTFLYRLDPDTGFSIVVTVPTMPLRIQP